MSGAAAFRRAAAVVAREFGVPPRAVLDTAPGCLIGQRRLRHVAVYLAHVVCSVPIRHVERDVGLPYATVWDAIRRVELLRDDPEFDARVQRLEEQLLEAVA